MASPWFFRLFVLFLFVSSGFELPSLAWFMVIAALVFSVLRLRYEAVRCPRKIIHVPDRLTNKGELERQYAAPLEVSLLIDADELASCMKTRLIARDAVIDSVSAAVRVREVVWCDA
ncbi:MAG: hypothetical protein KDI16_14770 [Halioglobus sp.]|nr:hypothetical protein [Halioglobus sp.]